MRGNFRGTKFSWLHNFEDFRGFYFRGRGPRLFHTLYRRAGNFREVYISRRSSRLDQIRESLSREFVNITIQFNAHAPSNCSTSISSCYRKHEMDKRRKYEQRIIDVEHGTFTPFVMSSSGGMGPSATITIKRLASLLAEKTQIPYPVMINTIRCRLSFSLIESAVMCIRGARSSINRPAKADHECPALIAQAIE